MYDYIESLEAKEKEQQLSSTKGTNEKLKMPKEYTLTDEQENSPIEEELANIFKTIPPIEKGKAPMSIIYL